MDCKLLANQKVVHQEAALSTAENDEDSLALTSEMANAIAAAVTEEVSSIRGLIVTMVAAQTSCVFENAIE